MESPKPVILGTSVKLKAGEFFRDHEGHRLNVGRSCGYPKDGKWLPADKGRVVYYCHHCLEFEEAPKFV